MRSILKSLVNILVSTTLWSVNILKLYFTLKIIYIYRPFFCCCVGGEILSCTVIWNISYYEVYLFSYAWGNSYHVMYANFVQSRRRGCMFLSINKVVLDWFVIDFKLVSTTDIHVSRQVQQSER